MQRVSFSAILLLLFFSTITAQNNCIVVNGVSHTSPTSCGATDGSISIDAFHVSGNTLQYSIDGGRVWHNTSTIGNLEAGITYDVELRDNIGLCFASFGNYLLDHPECDNPNPCETRPFTITAASDQAICGGESVNLNVTAGLSHSWSPTSGLSASNIANPVASPTSTTTYSVTITNQEGCTAIDEITVTVDNDPNCSGERDGMEEGNGDSSSAAQTNCIIINTVTTTDPSDCSSTDGSISIDAIHTTGNQLQYSIDGGRTWVNNSTISGLEAGVTYAVEVRDNIGLCFESHGDIILNCTIDPCVLNPFTIIDYPDQTVCSGERATLNASAGVSYSWFPVTGLNTSTIANPTASPSTTTTYTVTVTNQEGCTATDAITVTVANLPTANAGIDQTICSGSSAQLSASGGTSYQWIPSTGLSNANIANPVATPTSTITYLVIIDNGNNCASTDEVTITVANNLSVSLGNDVIVCPEENYTLSASGGSNYNWSPASGLDNASSPTPTANITTTTTYCVTVTDANGCQGTDCITIEVDNICEGEDIGEESNSGETINPCIIGPAVVACPDKFMCPNGQAQLVVNGGIRWEWSPATGLDDPFSSNPIATPSVTTTYTVTGWDANGCTATDVVDVVVVTSGNCATVPPCHDPTLLPDEEFCIDATTPIAQVCLPYSLDDLNITFTISLADGTPNIIHGCGFSDIYSYQYNFLPMGGQGTDYQINGWVVNNTNQTGVANSMQELLSFMQSVDPAGGWILDANRLSIIGGSTTSNYGDIMITQNGIATILGKNTTQSPTGTLVEVNMVGKDREILTFIDLVTGCIDQMLIRRCTP